MKREDFGKAVAAALEVSAQAHPVRTEYDSLMKRTTIYALDADEVLWRIQIEEPPR